MWIFLKAYQRKKYILHKKHEFPNFYQQSSYLLKDKLSPDFYFSQKNCERSQLVLFFKDNGMFLYAQMNLQDSLIGYVYCVARIKLSNLYDAVVFPLAPFLKMQYPALFKNNEMHPAIFWNVYEGICIYFLDIFKTIS